MVDLDAIPAITDRHADHLNERQLLDYQSYRNELLEWLLVMGENPDSVGGYAYSTVQKSAHRIDSFHAFVWEKRGYTTTVTPEDADEFMKELAYSDHSSNHKSNTQKAVKRVFKFREHKRGGDSWNPEITFSSDEGGTAPREFLTLEERRNIREAALEIGTIPAYSGLTADQREKWKTFIAQSLQKPKEQVTKADWERINGWKIPSLVWTSLDAGLRPVEVERAVVSWVDTENSVLRIPKEDSSKNEGNWTVALQTRTAEALKRWIAQRENYEHRGTNLEIRLPIAASELSESSHESVTSAIQSRLPSATYESTETQ